MTDDSFVRATPAGRPTPTRRSPSPNGGFAAAAVMLAGLLTPTAVAAQGTPYTFTRIADSPPLPAVAGASCVGVNGAGTVVFVAGGVVWQGSGSTLVPVIQSDSSGQLFTGSCPAVNGSGDIVYAFSSISPAYTALRKKSGSTVTDLAASDVAPFLTLPGSIAIHTLTSTGSTLMTGADGMLYLMPAGAAAFSLGASDPPLSSIEAGTMNDSHVVAFRATRAVLGVNKAGIYRGQGVPLVEDGNPSVPLIGASRPAINNSGVVVFLGAWPDGSTRVLSTLDGVAFTDHSGTVVIATTQPFSLNDAGTVVFAALAGGGQTGVFTGPDAATDKVIGPGDALDGSTVVRTSLSSQAINASGQIAFWAELADGRSGVYRANPVRAPVASDGSLGTTRNVAAIGTLAAADPAGLPLTYAIVANGTRGTAVITDAATGAFTYTPGLNSIGIDTVTFRANNGVLDSNVATVTVTIGAGSAGNTAPVAQAGGSTPAAAVRFDAVVDSLSRTTNLPAITSFTMMGWVKIVGDTTTYSSLLAFGTATNTTSVFRMMRCCGNGWGDLLILDGVNGPRAGDLDTPIGAWYHIALTVSGTQVTAYINGVRKISFAGNPNIPAQKFFIANDGRNQWFNGSVAGVKFYDVPLSDAEVAAEAQQFGPVRTANLNAFYPLQSAVTAATDLSGNDRTLTASGTLATDPNGPPVLVGNALTTPEDTPISGTLSATDAEGNPLTYAIVSNGTKGTVVITDPATGAYVYTPHPDTSGTDTFTFKANDGQLDSNVATITVIITTVNDPPVAADGSTTVTSGASVNGTLVATDVDTTARTFTLVTNAAKGTATITNATTGAYTYTANSGTSGTDTFTFRANDGTANSNVATVTVSITASPVPVASSGSLTIVEDTATSGGLSAAVQDGSPLTYSIVANGTKGAAVITDAATGAYTYTPNQNATGADTFTFRASNGSHVSNTATVSITITPVDDAPVAVNGTVSVAAGGSVGGTLVATDVDTTSRTFAIVSNGTKGTATVTNAASGTYTYNAGAGATGTDTFTFRANDGNSDSNVAMVTVTITVSPNPVASNGSLAVTEDTAAGSTLVATDPAGLPLTYSIVTNGAKGTATITNAVTGAYAYTPSANATGSDAITFQASNGSHTSNTATVAITITAVNDAPVAANGNASVAAGASVTGMLTATDVDSPNRTFAIVGNGTKGIATITNPTTGAFTYTANAGTSGTDTFTFRASDGSLDSNVATITITITGTVSGNTAPVALAGGSTPAAAVRFDAVADSLSRTTNLPAITSFTMMGWVKIVGDTTTYSSLLAFGTSGNTTSVFRMMRCCGNGWGDLLVLDGLAAPRAGDLDTPIGAWYHIALAVSGTQVAAYVNGVRTLTFSGNPNIPAQKFFIANDGRNQWFNGSVAAVKFYDVPLSDAEIAQEAQQFAPVRTANLNAFYPLQSAATAATDFSGNDRTLTLGGSLTTDANGPPVLAGAALTTAEDTPFTGTLQATDAEGNALTYAIVSNGTKGTVVITDPATGAYVYTPNPDTTGTDTFTFKANDGQLDSNVATITVIITPVNDPPVAADGTATLPAGSSVSGTLVATDVDTTARTFTLVTNGTKGTATITNASTGAYTYTANAASSGTDTFTFTANDGTANSNVATITVAITVVPPPVASNGTLSTLEDTAGTGTLSATDPNASPLTYSIVTNGSKGIAVITNNSTGAFTYTPNLNANGADSFTFRASNGSIVSNTATVSITITPVNDAPVAINGAASVGAGASVNGTLAATDVDSTPSAFVVMTNGTKGTATVTNASTGAYTYVANPGTSGTDTFTFRASDGQLNSNTATVTLTIAAGGPVNRPPVPMPVGSPAASVRFDSVSDELFSTTNLPSVTSFTIMGWFRFLTDTNTYSSAFRLGHETSSNGYNLLRCCGNGWLMVSLWNGSGIQTVVPNLTLGTWKHYAVTVEGSGPGQVKTYVDGVLALTSDGNPAITAGRLSIGNDAHHEWLDGNAAAVKIYDVALTEAEVAQELSHLAPIRTANLNAWYPLQSGENATNDFSGNNRMLTMGGTVTSAASGPPISTGLMTAKDTALNGTLQASDPDGDPVTFSLVTAPAHGTVVVNVNGTFTYTPAAGFVGTDSFTFAVSDGIASATATVDVTITP